MKVQVSFAGSTKIFETILLEKTLDFLRMLAEKARFNHKARQDFQLLLKTLQKILYAEITEVELAAKLLALDEEYNFGGGANAKGNKR